MQDDESGLQAVLRLDGTQERRGEACVRYNKYYYSCLLNPYEQGEVRTELRNRLGMIAIYAQNPHQEK